MAATSHCQTKSHCWTTKYKPKRNWHRTNKIPVVTVF